MSQNFRTWNMTSPDMDKDKLCNRVLEADSRIRFAGLINKMGRLVAGGMKPGLLSLEESKDNEMIFLQLALKVNQRKEFDKAYGPVEFSMAYRDKLIIMSFPVNDYILLISSEKEVDFFKLPFKILEIIHNEN
nr:DUF6659 family protein [Candidatus Nitrosotalea bavarica]